MDLPKVAGLGTTIELCGRTFEIVPNRVRDIAEFTNWLHLQLDNPIRKVMEALQSPTGLERDRWAAKVLQAWESEQKAAAADKREPDGDLAIDAQLAREWQEERKQLMLQAYEDAYGPKPPLESRIFQPAIRSISGACYDLWLALRVKHGEEFPTHWHVVAFIGDNVADLLRARGKAVALNDPDPEKNSPSRPSEEAPAASKNPGTP